LKEVHASDKKKKGQHYDQAESIYPDRTFGGDCHHRDPNGDIDAGASAGERTGQGDNLSRQPATIRYRTDHVSG
jgi:hypothetical protein